MKTNQIIELPVAAALLLATFNPRLATLFAQGSLTPPDPPGPTMKSLAQVEPRTPISSLPFTVTNAHGDTVGEILNFSAGGTITNASPWANFSY